MRARPATARAAALGRAVQVLPAHPRAPYRWPAPRRTRQTGTARSARGVAWSSSHLAARLDLLVDVVGQVADDPLVLVAGDQRQALAGDPTQLLELLHQVAHDLAQGRPVHLVARQVADLAH